MNYIPNIITCLNLLFGCIASVTSLESGNYKKASIFIILACFCDFLDGLFASLLRVKSKLGVELDSLADIVSFGFAPSCFVYAFLKSISNSIIIPYFAFLLVIFSALRLARFNIDIVRNNTFFRGLPVPSSALFWIGFVTFFNSCYYNCISIVILTILLVFIFCFLMISSLHMISFKFKNLKWRDNFYSYALIIISVIFYVLCLILGISPLGISLIIIIYIILSVIKNIKTF
ncbi:MAG: CDP-alcohol phosphatidyltransferase family protein [Bacteroidales bacterium OttesenSCG-928-I14]|jgi:CDP-diacylglycerol--serine O-phosphatidyltransferase|nr:CDP-alcohol phosphatidyltransferase family protein [Bacteroidales bacterium OttesenSCG-928-I14]